MIKYKDDPMQFQIKLMVKNGHRIYMIKSRGYKYDDTKY